MMENLIKTEHDNEFFFLSLCLEESKFSRWKIFYFYNLIFKLNEMSLLMLNENINMNEFFSIFFVEFCMGCCLIGIFNEMKDLI